jgi:hypothetical protein
LSPIARIGARDADGDAGDEAGATATIGGSARPSPKPVPTKIAKPSFPAPSAPAGTSTSGLPDLGGRKY